MGFALFGLVLFGAYQPQPVTLTFLTQYLLAQATTALVTFPLVLAATIGASLLLLPLIHRHIVWIPGVGGLLQAAEGAPLATVGGALSLRLTRRVLVQAGGRASGLPPAAALAASIVTPAEAGLGMAEGQAAALQGGAQHAELVLRLYMAGLLMGAAEK